MSKRISERIENLLNIEETITQPEPITKDINLLEAMQEYITEELDEELFNNIKEVMAEEIESQKKKLKEKEKKRKKREKKLKERILINKKILYILLQEKLPKYSEQEIKEFLSGLFEVLYEQLLRHKTITLPSFGSLKVKKLPEHTCELNGKEYYFPERYKPILTIAPYIRKVFRGIPIGKKLSEKEIKQYLKEFKQYSREKIFTKKQREHLSSLEKLQRNKELEFQMKLEKLNKSLEILQSGENIAEKVEKLEKLKEFGYNSNSSIKQIKRGEFICPDGMKQQMNGDLE